jgi:hypothetical protein
MPDTIRAKLGYAGHVLKIKAKNVLLFISFRISYIYSNGENSLSPYQEEGSIMNEIEKENEQSEDTTTIEKIKNHIKENKQIYIGVVIGVTVTLVAVAATNRIKIYRLNESNKIANKINNMGQLTVIPSQNTNVYQTVLAPREFPAPKPVRCIETGELFASQNRACEVYGIEDPNIMSMHLRGLLPDAKGYHFEWLPETAAA